jgi:hypothetical protein
MKALILFIVLVNTVPQATVIRDFKPIGTIKTVTEILKPQGV